MVFKRFIPSRPTHFFGTVLAAGWCHDLSKRQAASIWWNLLCDHRKANGRRRSPTLFGYVSIPCFSMFHNISHMMDLFFQLWKATLSRFGVPPHRVGQYKVHHLVSPVLPTVPASPVSSYDLGICPTLGQLEGWWHHVTIASDEANLERDALWDCSCIRSKETFCFKAWQMVCPWLSVQRLPTDYMGKHCQIPIIVDIDMIRYVQNLGKSLLQTAKL